MKKIIRSTNDLLLAVLMGGLSIFLLLSKKIITGVENGLGGMWAQASTYIHLLAGILLAMAILQLIYAIDFRGAQSTKSCAFRCRGKLRSPLRHWCCMRCCCPCSPSSPARSR